MPINVCTLKSNGKDVWKEIDGEISFKLSECIRCRVSWWWERHSDNKQAPEITDAGDSLNCPCNLTAQPRGQRHHPLGYCIKFVRGATLNTSTMPKAQRSYSWHQINSRHTLIMEPNWQYFTDLWIRPVQWYWSTRTCSNVNLRRREKWRWHWDNFNAERSFQGERVNK